MVNRNLIKSSITAVQNQATGLTARMCNAVKWLTGTCSNPALQRFRAKQEGCKPEYARQWKGYRQSYQTQHQSGWGRGQQGSWPRCSCRNRSRRQPMSYTAGCCCRSPCRRWEPGRVLCRKTAPSAHTGRTVAMPQMKDQLLEKSSPPPMKGSPSWRKLPFSCPVDQDSYIRVNHHGQSPSRKVTVLKDNIM